MGMKLATLRFGEIDVEEEKIIFFPQGVPGFEKESRYIMLQPEESIPFSFMQSVEDGELAFIITNPFLFFPDYQFDLPEPVEEELQVESEADVMIFSIVSVNEQENEFSLNLLAPVVINLSGKLGKQVILHNAGYHTKHLISFNGQSEQDPALPKDV
jgi:flagellar assembly factor FliW